MTEIRITSRSTRRVSRLDDEQYWLYAAVGPETDELLPTRLFQTRLAQLTVLFSRELRQQQQAEQL